MLRTALPAALLLSLAVPSLAQRAPVRPPVAITGVTVVDVVTGARLRNRTVLLRGEQIVAVGLARQVRLPAPVIRVDGRGKFLIPGLWDTHVHVGALRTTTFPLLLAHGITAARDLHLGPGANPAAGAVALRDSLKAGMVLGPRYLVGTQIAAPGFGAPTALHASTPEEGREMVRRLHAEHVDIVKAYSGLTLETYLAILGEAKRLGLPVDGHVSNNVGARAASQAGQRTIEHVAESGLLAGCTTSDSAWRAEVRQVRATPGGTPRGQLVWGVLRRTSEAYDEPSCRSLARELARNGTAVTPTLHTSRLAYLRFDAPPTPSDERGFLPAAQRQWYDSALVAARSTPEQDAWRAHVRRERDIVRVMHDEGVLVLAGTDVAPWGFPVPGASLHEELALLVDAGLTPLRALQAATINPARAFRMTDSLGTVAPGKRAEVVLLDADPLLDIANARRIAMVYTRGRYLDRAALDSMLAEVRKTFAARP